MKKVIVLVCALTMIAGTLLVVGCGGGSSSGDSPKAVMGEFMEAYVSADVDGCLALVTEASKEDVDEAEIKEELEAIEEEMGGLEYEVGEEEIDGDTAKVSVTMNMEGMEIKMKYYLSKEDGSWKIDMTKDPEIDMEGLEDTFEDMELEDVEVEETTPESESAE